MAKRSDEASATPPGSDRLTPHAIDDYRAKLTRDEDIVHSDAWAGAIPASSGIAPRMRIGAKRWFNVVWLVPIGFALLLCAIAVAKGLRGLPSVEQFIQRHPGTGYATRFDHALPRLARQREDRIVDLPIGQLLVLARGLEHDVEAVGDSAFLLTLG